MISVVSFCILNIPKSVNNKLTVKRDPSLKLGLKKQSCDRPHGETLKRHNSTNLSGNHLKLPICEEENTKTFWKESKPSTHFWGMSKSISRSAHGSRNGVFWDSAILVPRILLAGALEPFQDNGRPWINSSEQDKVLWAFSLALLLTKQTMVARSMCFCPIWLSMPINRLLLS